MSNETDWNSNIGGGFGQHNPATDDFYHKVGAVGDSMTETWMWNFHVPEAAINCFVYCWVHPNLNLVSGGLFLYKGFKNQHMECELFDYFNYMNANIIGDGSLIQLPNGLRIEVIKPLEKIKLSYRDPARQTALEVELNAVHVPIMRANNQHFEQLMHATGNLELRGQSYAVDCHPVRDRSWGELRPESHASSPAYTWVTGAFGEDFAFNVGSHDDPARNPDWLGVFEPPERIFKDGWVLVKGEQRRIVKSSKNTRRELPLCRPMEHEYQFEDSEGETYTITGKVLGQTHWSGWSNVVVHFGLIEWEWNGKKGWGDCQEVQWNDFVWRMNNR